MYLVCRLEVHTQVVCRLIAQIVGNFCNFVACPPKTSLPGVVPRGRGNSIVSPKMKLLDLSQKT